MTEMASLKTLVVDDSGAVRKIVIAALEKLAIVNVTEAASGDEALYQVSMKSFDLVLMDWHMPGTDGIEAIRQIRAKGNKMPIIMVTTESGKERVLEALVAGANNYISKPFTNDVFATKVHSTLKRAKHGASRGTPAAPQQPAAPAAPAQAAPNPAQKTAPPTPKKKARLSTMKGLVVDDSPTTRQVLVRYFYSFGVAHVDEAGNGREAIEKISDEDYGMVLMDWNMPEMDGLETVKFLRRRGTSVPIIMVTSKSDKKFVLEAIVAGANNYICKPFTQGIFKEKMKETMTKVYGQLMP